MNRIEIRALIQEKNEWCVSIIIPTSRTSPERRVDEVLQKSISYTKTIIRQKKPPIDIYNLLVISIDKLALQVDLVHAVDGLGIFVSPDMARLVLFPFPVKEKIMVDQTFETRDLYYLEQFSKPYYVLKLTKNEAHLFLLETGTVAREITNTHFPMRNGYAFEHAKPTMGTSFGFARKGFEKDKSSMNKTRLKSFFKEVQHNLLARIKTSDVLITGSRNILFNFESAPDNHLKIRGRIIGNFKDQNDLFTRARSTYFEYKHDEIQILIDRLDEFVGTKKVTFGIRDVWSAANTGKGDMLLVEKDFRKVGDTLQSGQKVSLPLAKHTKIPDLADQIIETIIDKGGRVVYTEDNQLEKYDQIALVFAIERVENPFSYDLPHRLI